MLRIYLSGHVTVEADGGRLQGSGFPGRQGRELFAFLVLRRDVPVPRSDLAAALWGADPPASWDTALSALVSKLRPQLSHVGVDGARALRSMHGCYRLVLPPDAWIDHDVAFDSLHEAETALRAGDLRAAYGPSAVARVICQRPFLAGSDGDWIMARRVKLRAALVRALECRSEVYLWNREVPLAVEAANEAIAIEPFRESSYRLLMKAYAAGGNSAEALQAYERCRKLIAEELGVPPSPETKNVYSEIIQAL